MRSDVDVTRTTWCPRAARAVATALDLGAWVIGIQPRADRGGLR
jgi:hypothetical protein